MTYVHECCECGEVLNELDKNLQGKPVLIFDDGGWFCRDCWKEMENRREAAWMASQNRGMDRDEWRHEALKAMRLK